MKTNIKLMAFALGISMCVAPAAWAGETCTMGEKVGAEKMVCPVTGASADGAKACCAKDKDAEAAAACAAKCEGKDKDIKNVSYEGSGIYELGSKVEDFKLTQAQTGEMKSLGDLAGEKATVIVFWNKDCPYVEGPKGAADRIEALSKTYANKGVSVIGIDAGVNNSPEAISEYSKSRSFPILINQDSSVAAKFAAEYTPHTFVLNGNHELVYHGAFDTRSGDELNSFTENAVKDLLEGKEVAVPSAKGTGCSLKYAEGMKPQVKQPTS